MQKIDDNVRIIRSLTSNAYSIQHFRIQIGNRLVTDYYLTARGTGEVTDDEHENLLSKIGTEYKSLTQGVADKLPTEASFNKKVDSASLIQNYGRLLLIHQYFELEAAEGRIFRQLGKELEKNPVYTGFLKDVKGCGVAMSAVLLSHIDFSKCKYASSLWAYFGLDVVNTTVIDPDTGEVTIKSEARGRKESHLREIEYVDREGNVKKRRGITYNHDARAKLLGVLASSFLRTGNEKYGKVYVDYKTRLSNMERHASKSKGHLHRMALRKAVSRFLVDLYVAGRTIYGYEVHPEYSEAKLGHVHNSPSDTRAA